MAYRSSGNEDEWDEGGGDRMWYCVAMLYCYSTTVANGFQGELRQLLMLSASRQELHEVFRREQRRGRVGQLVGLTNSSSIKVCRTPLSESKCLGNINVEITRARLCWARPAVHRSVGRGERKTKQCTATSLSFGLGECSYSDQLLLVD